MRIIIRSIFCFVFFLLLGNLALAIETGKIQGRVQDENEAGLPGVTVMIFSPSLQGTRSTASSEDGDFQFSLGYLIELDRQLGASWALKARYIHTVENKMLAVLAVFDPNTLYKFLYDNFEYKRRNFLGLEFELNGSFGPRLFINASYAHSLAKGTNPGHLETGSWSQTEGGHPHFRSGLGKTATPPGPPNLKNKVGSDLDILN